MASVSASDSRRLVCFQVSSTSAYYRHARKSRLTSISSSLTLWYPRYKLQYRVGLFFGAASISGAFSGILAYGISFMSGTAGMLGWSWIFVRRVQTLSIINEITLIQGRFLKDVRPFASESLPPSVRASFIKIPSSLVTSVNSDGGLSIDRHVPDPRGEEYGDVDQKYDSPMYPSAR